MMETIMEPVEFGCLRHDEDGRMWHEGKLFTGVAVEYWPNGQLASELHYADGIEDGWSRSWHQNGVPSTETLFIEGCATGRMKKWHPNGQLQLEKEIELGIRLWSKEWDEVGELVTEYLLTEDQPEYSMLQLWRQKERQKQLAEND